MTKCRVSVSVTHPNYAAFNHGEGIVAPAHPGRTVTGNAAEAMGSSVKDTETQTEPDESVGDSPSPNKRIRVQKGVGKGQSRVRDRNRCRICFQRYEEGGDELWVGCGYVSKRGRKICDKWVHQRCIWIRHVSNGELKRVPIFCPEHYQLEGDD